MVEVMKINPNIRLLKMLGEDLIKDEKTAVIELVKNSYDADATRVRIFFKNFGTDFEVSNNSEIFIMDNGDGMSKHEIENNWLSPGTANKKKKKKAGEKTKLGRVYQGEKGIGRYSMLKLARTVEVFSKLEDEAIWNHAKIDLSGFDEDYIDESEESISSIADLDIFYDNKECDELSISQYINEKGTIIRLTNLNGNWNSNKVTDIYNDLARLEPISTIIYGWKSNKNINSYFEEYKVKFYLNGNETNHRKKFLDDLEKLLNLQEKKCIMSIENGYFNDKTGLFDFDVNDSKYTVNINDKNFNKLGAFKKYFIQERENFKIEDLKCGPFNFEFYIFNLNTVKYLEKYKLTNEEKELVENHRIYLYRDNARVYPYGEKKNDWLAIDALRGSIKANQIFSNSQTIGFISISYDKNPKLQDKSNREGLIEEDEITFEFIALIQSLLNYIRMEIYNAELTKIKNFEEQKGLLEQEDERKKLEEIRKQQEEEERKRLEEIRKQQEEEERKRLEEIRKQQEEEEYKKLEELKKHQEELLEDPLKSEVRSPSLLKIKTKTIEFGQELYLKDPDILIEFDARIIASSVANIKDYIFLAENKPGNYTINYYKDAIKETFTIIVKNRKVKFSNSDIKFFGNSSWFIGEIDLSDIGELVKQLYNLNYENHYLLYVISFRAILEDMVKKYNYKRNLNLKGNFKDNILLMTNDLKEVIRAGKNDPLKLKKEKIHTMFKGYDNLNNNLVAIDTKFRDHNYDKFLHSLTHNPVRIEIEFAKEIANELIVPLHMLIKNLSKESVI